MGIEKMLAPVFLQINQKTITLQAGYFIDK